MASGGVKQNVHLESRYKKAVARREPSVRPKRGRSRYSQDISATGRPNHSELVSFTSDTPMEAIRLKEHVPVLPGGGDTKTPPRIPIESGLYRPIEDLLQGDRYGSKALIDQSKGAIQISLHPFYLLTFPTGVRNPFRSVARPPHTPQSSTRLAVRHMCATGPAHVCERPLSHLRGRKTGVD